MRKFIQHDPPHPGKILMELYLKPLRISVADAAEKMGTSRISLLGFIEGKTSMSYNLARKLSKIFNTSIRYWMNLQYSHDFGSKPR